ncbi:MAG: formyltetrahydrofolate deformylase [Sphaerochaetaceae bacterium]|jgi:formyltetrahydrofolate deformylase
MHKIIFLIHCEDRKGLLATISQYFYSRGYNILHCQQHSDVRSNRYYMRIELDLADLKTTRKELQNEFNTFAQTLNLTWQCHFTDYRNRVALMVSKTSHCLFDLLSRQHEGDLKCDFPLIISNHITCEPIAEQFRVPYYYLPITKGNKAEQETQVHELLKTHDIDVIVLARYMQVLSEEFTSTWWGKVINIHHAFLPAFQGANPYLRAYERGVKMIGATAHYASEDLDQGPIIEQDVVRVNHELSPEGLRKVGKDVERQVLFRAVQAHLEHRIIMYNNRTVVFNAEY